MPIPTILCQCGNEIAIAAPAITRVLCVRCKRMHTVPQIVRAPAGTTGSMTAGEAAQAEVRKLAERVTVLEGRVDELCRALRSRKFADAPAETKPAPLDKGYWR